MCVCACVSEFGVQMELCCLGNSDITYAAGVSSISQVLNLNAYTFFLLPVSAEMVT